MSSNFNTNQRTREYSYRNQIVDDYPNITSDNGWHDISPVSPRMSINRRIDAQSMRSSNILDSSAKSKDEFTIFGSFTRQKSERNSAISDRPKTLLNQSSNFKNLPVKNQPNSDFSTSEYTQITKSENVPRLQSQPKYTPPDSLFDLIQRKEQPMVQESIVPVNRSEVNSMPDDEELTKLLKNAEKMSKKMAVLEANNEQLQKHLKNLLNERKQLLRQIESSEFEEIIEEEEVQQAAATGPKVIVEREEVARPAEVSHVNCLQRGRITLNDVSREMLDAFRNDILAQERQHAEMEKRALMETLKTEQQKQLRALQNEYEAKETAVRQVSVQSYKKTSVNHIVTEANLAGVIRPSIVPVHADKQSQYEFGSQRTFTANNSLSSWQKSVLEQVIKSVEERDHDKLVRTIWRPCTAIGVGNAPQTVAKSTNTLRATTTDSAVETTVQVEVFKKSVSQESRSVMAKPVLLQRGCQPEDTFKFETGTMTDQIFCRSQGIMTVGDFTEHKSPVTVDGDIVINRAGNRSETRRQTVSQTTYVTSPTKELLNKASKKIPEKVVEEEIEIRKVKPESAPKPKTRNLVEEIEHKVEVKTQQVTSVLDQNKVPKQEIPTTIECWETISHLKDGELIEKTETYHDRLVSTDIEKIKLHMDQHDLSSPTVVNQENATNVKTSPIKTVPINLVSSPNEVRRSSTTTETRSYHRDESTASQSFFGSSSKDKKVLPNIPISIKQKTSTLKAKEVERKIQEKVNKPTERNKETVEIKENKTRSSFSQPEVNDIKSEHTTFRSGLKKPSDKMESVKETVTSTVIQKSSEIKKPIHTEKEYMSVSSMGKKLNEGKEITVNRNLISPPKVESKNTKSKEFKENKNEPEVKDTTYHESEYIVVNSGLKKPNLTTQIEIQQTTSLPIKKETSTVETKQGVVSSSFTKTTEVKEKIEQQNFSTSIEKQSPSQESTSTKAKPIEIKEVKVQQHFSEPSHKESAEHRTDSGGVDKPVEVKVPLRTETTIHESEETTISTSLRNPPEFHQVKVQQTFSIPKQRETTYQESEQMFQSSRLTRPSEMKEIVIQDASFRIPSLKETTHQESEQTYTYTTTTSSMPSTVDANRESLQFTKPNSIGILTSPSSFKSYSSSRGRTGFASSRTENYSFESDLKFTESVLNSKSVPIQLRSDITRESIPINEFSTESTMTKITRIPITVTGSSSGPSTLSSSNSPFHSLSSSKEFNYTVKSNKDDSVTTDCSQILLPENIFKYCSQLMIWLKSINIITSSTVDQLPDDLIDISAALVDWWVDMTARLDAGALMATIKYLTSTFSKNLLKYLIINLDQQGNTCLHYIVGNQMWASFSLLESTNLVDPNIYNKQGYTILMIACTIKIKDEIDRENLRRLTLSANVNLKSKLEGQTAIFIAALHNNSHAIQMLYTLGADINIRDNSDSTPLMVACANNSIDAVITILSWSGVLVDLKNKDGKTAFDIAEERHFSELMEIFSQRKTTRASELSSYSSTVQNSYITRPFVTKKY